MKTNATQMEILLLTGTSFASQQFAEREPVKDNNSSESEMLESLCWNGLLEEILPEINPGSDRSKEIFLWQIIKGKSFIELEMGETPGMPDRYFSIDPYAFFSTKLMS
jgi:hypothetical protein